MYISKATPGVHSEILDKIVSVSEGITNPRPFEKYLVIIKKTFFTLDHALSYITIHSRMEQYCPNINRRSEIMDMDIYQKEMVVNTSTLLRPMMDFKHVSSQV